MNHVQEGLTLLMVFKKLIRYTGLAVGLMVCEKFIRYAGLAVGLKPSARGGEGRLRGLYLILKTHKEVSDTLSRPQTLREQ